MQIIIRNAVRCNHCGDVIDSNYTHDFKTCCCGRVTVDGGHDYLRRCAASENDYTELSEMIEIDENKIGGIPYEKNDIRTSGKGTETAE